MSVGYALLAEIVTTLLIVAIAVIAAFIFGPQGLVKGLGLGITFIMFVYFGHLYLGAIGVCCRD